METIVRGPKPGTPEWLLERRNHIGASEAAAACGLSPYSQPLEVYLRKRGEMPEAQENEAMRMGKKLEPIILSEMENRIGWAIDRDIPMLWRPDCAFIAATPDGMEEWTEPVEAKSTSWRRAHEWGDEGTDQVPTDYLLQCQQQIYVCGASFCRLGVLIDGRTLRVYTIKRHLGLIQRIIEAETELWQRIQDGRPPEPNWTHPRTAELVRDIHGLKTGLSVDLDYATDALVSEWESAKEAKRNAEERAEALKARILHAMGDAELGCLPEGGTLIRKEVARPKYEVKATTYITLTHKRK